MLALCWQFSAPCIGISYCLYTLSFFFTVCIFIYASGRCCQVGKLKTLRSFMDMSSGNMPVTICKLAMLSLMEVFKDMLPEYRIRVFTSKEKHQKVSDLHLCFGKIAVHGNIPRLTVEWIGSLMVRALDLPAGTMLCNNLKRVVVTCLSLSQSSINWYSYKTGEMMLIMEVAWSAFHNAMAVSPLLAQDEEVEMNNASWHSTTCECSFTDSHYLLKI